ncbi:hypothetical protein GUITHDRAFT_135595 [Guillardia theta CCMP2712]|uniref:Uncharacterized protein n=1 Tax=Guillardia theta (strain CCMP2712) TaxID=905079 RepID=L1JN88_GUITC|nr:hypothetical protein GUITHDRAFT_135595 [Guillardia theta CCMP2712]EKX49902.1 hypothetical protein GUITHDRAFT_135595 [Guillardia theta CCMP2712]|eukprot:XP_005836882.1 hypothetical protein GUITHDRAFT_135595 [Guillardia theta CCMP2712]
MYKVRAKPLVFHKHQPVILDNGEEEEPISEEYDVFRLHLDMETCSDLFAISSILDDNCENIAHRPRTEADEKLFFSRYEQIWSEVVHKKPITLLVEENNIDYPPREGARDCTRLSDRTPYQCGKQFNKLAIKYSHFASSEDRGFAII